MVKSYTRYELIGDFGAVCSGDANCIAVSPKDGNSNYRNDSHRVLCAVQEDLILWDLKRTEKIFKLHDANCSSPITRIARSAVDDDYIACGHQDGSIRIWSFKNQELLITFEGHRSAVTVLEFDPLDLKLLSGSQDTCLIYWDIVAEKGVVRLSGHSDSVTGACFMTIPNLPTGSRKSRWIISSSKDAMIKIWDLSYADCIETQISVKGSVWAIIFRQNEDGNFYVLSLCADQEIQIWEVVESNLSILEDSSKKVEKSMILQKNATITRQNRKRPIGIFFHDSLPYFAVPCADKAIELFKIRSTKEIERLKRRREKRLREKSERKEEKKDDSSVTIDLSDFFCPLQLIHTSGKVSSVSWIPGYQSHSDYRNFHLIVQQRNNLVESYDIQALRTASGKEKDMKYDVKYSLSLQGHRTDIRGICISEDERRIASASGESLKIWDIQTGNCIQSFATEQALSCRYLAHDQFIMQTSKSGNLSIFHVDSRNKVLDLEAHTKACWAAEVNPNDEREIITCSADKEVKFWNLQLAPTAQMNLNKRVLLPDEALFLKCSPNGKYIIVSLLDCTCRIYFTETVKLFLSLYGHSLPVLYIDVSDDNKLVITSSADKNIKIWGLDFGDCHKSIFAHTDTIMSVKFIPGSHNFVSASKDQKLKVFDADNFQHIMTLSGFHGEVWALDIGKNLGILAAASHDMTIRCWEQGSDDVFLQEERELEEEKRAEDTLAANIDRGISLQSANTGKLTSESLKASEKLIEALKLAIIDHELMSEYQEKLESKSTVAAPRRNPIFVALGNITASQYVYNLVEKLRFSQIEDTLLMLPLENVVQLLTFLEIWASERRNNQIILRISSFLVRAHYNQIISNKLLRSKIEPLRTQLRSALLDQRSEIGFNIAGLKYLDRNMALNSIVCFRDSELDKEGSNTTKRSFVSLS